MTKRERCLVGLATWVDFAGLSAHCDATMWRPLSLKPSFWCLLNPIDRCPVWRGKRSYIAVLVVASSPFLLLEASGTTAPSVSTARTIISKCNAKVGVVILREVPESNPRALQTLAGTTRLPTILNYGSSFWNTSEHLL